MELSKEDTPTIFSLLKDLHPNTNTMTCFFCLTESTFQELSGSFQDIGF